MAFEIMNEDGRQMMSNYKAMYEALLGNYDTHMKAYKDLLRECLPYLNDGYDGYYGKQPVDELRKKVELYLGDV